MPDLFLIAASAWQAPSKVFVDHGYEGKKSKPEWGINVSKKNMLGLEPYRFERVVSQLRPAQK